MAIEGPPPTHRTTTGPNTPPQSLIELAAYMGLVIECIGPSGTIHSFVPALPENSLWAARCTLRSGDSRTWVVDNSVEDTIRDCIRRCEPDVRLVTEEVSQFGEGDV